MRQACTLAILAIVLTSCKNEPQPIAEVTPTPPAGMVHIPGGTYLRGNERPLRTKSTFEEEKPVHTVQVSAFFMDETEVTNAQFRKFTEATGYVTIAEKGFSADDFPLAPPEQLAPGAILFDAPPESLDPSRVSNWQWWKFVPGASWRHPDGPESTAPLPDDHPVRCVTYEDAAAYAEWAGKRLPTEAEWERAARGGLEQKLFTWGDSAAPDGKWMANIFQGDFPHNNTAKDGFANAAPVRSFPPNAYGLFDMAGNVWELCSDHFSPIEYQKYSNRVAIDPKGPDSGLTELDLNAFYNSGTLKPEPDPNPFTTLHSIRGGSFLCHFSYCLRYRPAARFYSESLSPTNHCGFRCVKDL